MLSKQCLVVINPPSYPIAARKVWNYCRISYTVLHNMGK